ncbi:hypothetical protein QJS10_CPB21g00998 [Acorus calamus]|uniref:Uncharacterized protein n=1 Tax=Acorus calamus TaxID=4465 RepID=A0AAV9C446_ACOCL|nr:hypothetical protein QJS10_CPB21g00998 [Acorus calamus]
MHKDWRTELGAQFIKPHLNKHLGLPLVQKRLLHKDWNPLIERFEKHLDGWQNRCLSTGGKLILRQAVLSNLPTAFPAPSFQESTRCEGASSGMGRPAVSESPTLCSGSRYANR